MFALHKMPLLVALLPTLALAQSLGECRGMRDPTARLACYDELAARAQPADAPKATKPSEASSADASSTEASASLLGRAWELDASQRGQILGIRQYKPVYVLPVFHAAQVNDEPNTPASGHSAHANLDATEVKFQISLKTKLMEDIFGNNGDLWFGYTQSSRWQILNGATSRPFRETNYEPEAMLIWRTDYRLGNWRGRMLGLTLNHQSNGASLPWSRSWNRVIGSVGLENGEWTLGLRGWRRLPENPDHNDNPDIADYLGRGEIHLVRHFGGHELSLLARHSLRSGERSHGAFQLDYAFPLAGSLRGHLQWFTGYGESLIDYNHRSNYLGIGVSLLEWY